MAKRTPAAPVLTYQGMQMAKSFGAIDAYLKLKEPLLPIEWEHFKENDDILPSELIKTQEAYERYLYYLKHKRLVQ